MRKNFCTLGWQSAGTGCPMRSWSFPCWRHSKPTWMCPCVTCSRWACLDRKAGLADLHRSFPILTILWLCDLYLMSFNEPWCSIWNSFLKLPVHHLVVLSLFQVFIFLFHLSRNHVTKIYSVYHLENVQNAFCGNLCKVSAGQYCYTTILKPFEVPGCEQIGKETLAAATRFWSLWISKLLCSFCIGNICQNSVEFCDGNEYQTTPRLLKTDINLNLSLAINLYLLLVKQRSQSSTYWPFWWEARTFAGNPP